MRILITGDKGFIGSHLRRKLEELKYEVSGFDIRRHPTEDMRNRMAVNQAFANFSPDIVIHLAALAGVRQSELYPELYLETNIIGTFNLLLAARRYKVKKFLFASSSSVYGDRSEALREDMICDNPLSLYAYTKIAGELLCKYFYDVPTIVFRPFTVYGENGRKDMVVYKLIEAGLTGKTFFKYGDGSSTRGYTNVHDLVDGIVRLMDYKVDSNFEVFNLGGQEVVRLNDLIKIVKEQFPKLKVVQVPRNRVDVKHSFADISKAKSKVGFNPKRRFEKEIRKLCKTLIE